MKGAVGVLVLVLALSVTTQPAAAQDVPRLSDGHPDMNGIWQVLNEANYDLEPHMARHSMQLREGPMGPLPAVPTLRLGAIGAVPGSLGVIVGGGKIPYTPAGRERAVGLFNVLFGNVAAGPEDRALAERCILGFNSGPPMLPSAYNNNVQLFQTPDTIVILNEMVHSARIVPLDGRSHLTDEVRQWVGDSRGRWDGDTLVVETTNFLRDTSFPASSEKLHLIERFTRVDADTLVYEFTVEDETTWTRPWTAAVPMRKSDLPLFEYACHEGNYGMTNLLAGARMEEQEP